MTNRPTAAAAYPPAVPALVDAISRRKLQSVLSDSSDTLRRCVLIHNIMRSTASLHNSPSIPSEPFTPPPTPTEPTTGASYSFAQSREEDEEEEDAYREAADASTASSHFVFPQIASYSPPSASVEQDWLDSILDDLGAGDVQVSVVDADEEMTDASAPIAPECEQPVAPLSCSPWHPPLFPTPHSPPSSPPLRPISPRCIPIPDTLPVAISPPASPPGLEDDDAMDSDEDDDDDEEYHYGLLDSSSEELTTPSASTEFPQAVGMGVSDVFLFSNLPFNRLRPVPVSCDLHHDPPY